MAEKEQIKVLLVDDHVIVREGLKSLLQDDVDILIVGEAGDGNEALKKAEELKPDVVIMDILMPNRGGIDATYAILKKTPGCKVLVLSMLEEIQNIEQAFKFGASGYILKSSGVDNIRDAVKRVAASEIVLSPSISKSLLQNYKQGQTKQALSRREFEVLGSIAEGLSNQEIAGRLFITESTVRTYIQRINEKLNFKNRAEAILYGIKHSVTTNVKH